MFDIRIRKTIDPSLEKVVWIFHKLNLSPNMITLLGFVFGLLACLSVFHQYYIVALIALISSRLFDALDGIYARKYNLQSEFGGYLDIVLDFIFYALFTVTFGLSDSQNIIPSLILLLTFFGTASSFLAYAIFKPKEREKTNTEKSFSFIGGLTEGTETICIFGLMCLLPSFFPFIAYSFASLCILTTIWRIYWSYRILV